LSESNLAWAMKTGQTRNELLNIRSMKTEISSSRFIKRARLMGFLLGLVLLLPSVQGKKDAYKFKFGLMTLGARGEPVVYLETKEIEKHTDPSYKHGFSMVRKNGAQFFAYFKVRFPKPIENIPAAVYEHYTVLENGRVFQSKDELVWELSESFVFDKSDPVGAYEMEVYADGELYRKIDYNVAAVPEFDF
jgi:hypothetical protein